jgi:hypothetical protein
VELSKEQQALVAELADRVDIPALGDRMVKVFVAEIPGYAELPEAIIKGQVRETAQGSLELFKRVIADPSLPTEEDLGHIRASARNRASEGLPLGDLLLAYRIGRELSWEAFVEVSRTNEERTALLGAAQMVMSYVDRLSSAVAETYLAESQHMMIEDSRLVAELIEVLSSDEELDRELRRFASRLGTPIVEAYRPFAMTVVEAPAHHHSQVAASLRLQGILARTEGDAVVGIAVPDTSPDALHGGRALLVLRDPVRRADLGPALAEARLLLTLARRRGQTAGIVEEAKLALPLLLARSPKLAAELHEQVIGPLAAYEDSRGSDLLKTIKVYFTHGLNRGRAAKALQVHPNTLDYRLGRIEELCTLSLSDPEDIARVELALTQADENGA